VANTPNGVRRTALSASSAVTFPGEPLGNLAREREKSPPRPKNARVITQPKEMNHRGTEAQRIETRTPASRQSLCLCVSVVPNRQDCVAFEVYLRASAFICGSHSLGSLRSLRLRTLVTGSTALRYPRRPRSHSQENRSEIWLGNAKKAL